MLTDTEKAALAERLAETMHDVNLTRNPEIFDTWEVEQSVEARHPDTGYVTLTREQAAACLPIIERVIAERDVDALVEGMGHATGIHVQYQGHHYQHKPELAVSKAYMASVEVLVEPDPACDGFGGWNVCTGTGPTRTAAIADAVQRAKEATP